MPETILPKDFAYYSAKFRDENVKLLLKDLKGSFKTNTTEKDKKNSSFGSLDFKIAMIRAA